MRLFIILLFASGVTHAHGGKVDKNGGHNSDKGYHYHKACMKLSSDEIKLITLVRSNSKLIKMLIKNNGYGDL